MLFSATKKVSIALTLLLVSGQLALADGAQSKVNICDLNADKCNGKPLDKVQTDKSLFLGDLVNNELEKLYEKNRAEGKELTAVIIAREGSNLKKFKILDDRDGQLDLQAFVQRLTEESRQKNMYNEGGGGTTTGIDYTVLREKINKKDQLKYSHLGIAFRNLTLRNKEGQIVSGPGSEDGPNPPLGERKWSFYHLLYSCEKPEGLQIEGEYIKSSYIFRGTVHSFFWDHLAGYNAQFIVPDFQLQKNLEKILVEQVRANAFKESQYNAAAKFDDLTQQNSNQFVLEAVAAAMAMDRNVNSRREAIEVLKQTNYSASKLMPDGLMSVVSIGFVQSLISNMMPTMCFKSQPELKKYGIGEIITSNSVVNWMKRNKMVESITDIGLDQKTIKEIEEHHASQEPKK